VGVDAIFLTTAIVSVAHHVSIQPFITTERKGHDTRMRMRQPCALLQSTGTKPNYRRYITNYYYTVRVQQVRTRKLSAEFPAMAQGLNALIRSPATL
jgi:hypothetical protein